MNTIPKCSACGCSGNFSCNNGKPPFKGATCELDQLLVCPCCKSKVKK